ncbi:MAG: hypothetical protein FJZ38_16720 [Candidatus Rokubacteria bacterium]|nr:hypothetical protein [Candidatus Rokubacteria bacterium]
MKLALWLVLWALAACGRVGVPLPPERVAPAPVGDLTGAVVDRGIELSWTIPTRRADNVRLRDLALLHVFRTDDDGTGDPKPALATDGRIAGYAEIAAIRAGDPAPAVIAGEKLTFVDTTATSTGRRYSYVVLAEDARRHVSAPSARLTVTRITPPAAPTAVRATPGDREVRLSWDAAPRLVDGTTASDRFVYQILRAPGPDAPSDVITQTAPGATSFVDRGVENDRPHVYGVRALRSTRGATARSEISERVTGMAVDTTPPAPPTELVAIPSAGTVRLAWMGSADADVSRYIVYRGRDDGPFERVGSTAAPGTTFTDRDVPAGRWRYAVTAQDTSSRANESRRSAEAVVVVP